MFKNAFLICSFFLVYSSFAQPSQQKADSLKNVLYQQVAKDSNRVLTLISYAGTLFYLQPDSSLMNYADEALQIAEELKWNKGIARSLVLKAVVYQYFWANPIQALNCYQKALKFNESIADKGFQWSTLMNIGNIDFGLNEYQQALTYYNQAYHILQQQEVRKGEDQLLMNMGHAYSKLNQNTKAEDFYTKSILLAEQSSDLQVAANALCSRGLLYQKEKKTKPSKRRFEKRYSISRKV